VDDLEVEEPKEPKAKKTVKETVYEWV